MSLNRLKYIDAGHKVSRETPQTSIVSWRAASCSLSHVHTPGQEEVVKNRLLRMLILHKRIDDCVKAADVELTDTKS